MKNLVILFFFFLLGTGLVSAQENNIPGDNVLRYYRLAIPVTLSAYEQDLNSDYDAVKQFWQECEDFANNVFVPLGICFDVVVDESLVMATYNSIDENVFNAPSFGTELTDAAIGSGSYDVGMWVTHRDDWEENSGLSVESGAYSSSTKSSGYAKTDKWVVAHELGHMFGAGHTPQDEGSLMDNEGEFFSYPSIKKIRSSLVNKSYPVGKSVSNTAPVFDTGRMKKTYSIPLGACMAIPLYASDAEGHTITYYSIGCSSATVDNVMEGGVLPHFASLAPQTNNVIDYRPVYSADMFYEDFYYTKNGTAVNEMEAGSYSIVFLANDVPVSTDYATLFNNPFYSNYSVWDATIQVINGTAFTASLNPAKNSYAAGEQVTVKWGVNSDYFNSDSRLRVTMSANYGKSFDYVLAESVPALDGQCTVVLPNVNVGNVDVDFITAVRSMRGGIIRVEEVGGIAYTLTSVTPSDGGNFTVTGGAAAPEVYTVTTVANPADGGSATLSVDGGEEKTSLQINAGGEVTLHAVANNGYSFVNWTKNGSVVSNSAVCSVGNISENACYTANFEVVKDDSEYLKYYSVVAEDHNSNAQPAWAVNDGGTSFVSTGNTAISNPAQKNFAFVEYDGNTYIYSVYAKKFVMKDASLAETRVPDAVIVEKLDNGKYFFKFDDSHYINIGGSKQMVIDGWNTKDGGNQYTLIEQGEFDATDVLAMISVMPETITFALTDNAGNEYKGTYEGFRGEVPAIGGVTYTDVVWDETTVTATVKFPFTVSKMGETPNETLLAIFNADKYIRAIGTDVKVQTLVDGETQRPLDLNALWAVYPSFNGNAFQFSIKNIATGKYICTESTGSSLNEQGTVMLGENATIFELTSDRDLKISGKNVWLSINSTNDKNVWLGTHNSEHGGTNVYTPDAVYNVTVTDVGYATFYASNAVAIPENVEAYYVAEGGMNADWVELTEIKGAIPAETAVILKAIAGTYTFNKADDIDAIDGNMLLGTVENTMISGEAYVLGLLDGKAGLAKAILTDGRFLNNHHKAYLPVAEGANLTAEFYGFGWDGTTGIDEVNCENSKMKGIYDLTGRKVQSPAGGIYIIDGKKVLIK